MLNGFLLLLDHPCPIADQAHKQADYCFFTLSSSSADFIFGRKVERLHSLILAEMHDFDNGKVQQAFMPEQLQKKIPYTRISERRIIIRKKDLDAWLESRSFKC